MFYPELYQIYDEGLKDILPEELLDNIDCWLAFLPGNLQDKITVARVSNKFNLNYSISRTLLEKLSDIEILERTFAIRCPECGFTLKLSNEQNIYNDIIEIKSHNTCYKCDADLEEIKSENIEVRYKLIKKPTNDPDKIKDSVENLLSIDSKKYDTNNLNDILEKANYDSNKLFYKPTEEQYTKLDELFRGFIKAESTSEKGDTLETFVEYLMNLIKPVTATKEGQTNTNQLDCLAVNNSILPNKVLEKIGHTFICECKNENKAPENGYYHKLANILNVSRKNIQEHKFGIIFSKKRPPSTYLEMAYKNYYMTNTTIITFFKDELEEIVYERKNLLGYIDYKMNLVQQDLKEKEDVKNIFL